MSKLALANIEHWQEESLRELKFHVGTTTGECEVPTENADGNTMTTTNYNYVHI